MAPPPVDTWVKFFAGIFRTLSASIVSPPPSIERAPFLVAAATALAMTFVPERKGRSS